MRFKVGDRVRIKSLDWYNENKRNGNVYLTGWFNFIEPMADFCGKIVTIKEVQSPYNYRIFEDEGIYFYTDEMIEGLVEEETKPEPKFKVGDSVEVLKSGNTYTISQMVFNGKEFVYALSNNGNTVCWFSEDELIDCKVEEEIEFTEDDKYWCDIMSESDPTTYVLPQGYQFVDENGNVINATKIVLEKKKKEYPKTYEECCNILGCKANHFFTDFSYNGLDIEISDYEDKIDDLLQNFRKLRYCRDAYWKIYGEEDGLGKPWEPDYTDPDQDRYAIANFMGNIEKSRWDYGYSITFVFPTEEMRDQFYENFKEDIERCKELL